MPDQSPFPVIETERLVLREVVDGDAERLFEIHWDQRWMEWWGADVPIDVEETRQLIDAWKSWRRTPNPGVRWGLQIAGESELVGTCGLFKWNRNWDSCSTSYEIATWRSGQGYMTEAMSAVLEWGADNMSLNRVEALVHPSNSPSKGLLERLGFEYEGRLRQAARWGGQYRDLLLMAKVSPV